MRAIGLSIDCTFFTLRAASGTHCVRFVKSTPYRNHFVALTEFIDRTAAEYPVVQSILSIRHAWDFDEASCQGGEGRGLMNEVRLSTHHTFEATNNFS